LPVKKWNEEFVKEVIQAGKLDTEYQKAIREWERDYDQQTEVAALARDELRHRHKPRSGLRLLDMDQGMVYRKGLLWVPNEINIIKTILESEHDTKVAGHMGQDKTIELIRRNFWGPKMDEQIIDFVRSCTECQKDKAARHQPYGMLQPLELAYSPWQSIAMDFITDLPLSDDCDQLWVVIDRFTKMAHFVPLKKEGKTTGDLVKIFAREIWRHHGLPTDIVSDRDSRFTSGVWKEFLQLLGIRPRMSTAFHPQTDGQTKRLNQTIEAYLRSFVNLNKTIGSICYQWPNSLTTIRLPWPTGSLPSMQISDSTLRPQTQRRRILSTPPARFTRIGCTRFTKGLNNPSTKCKNACASTQIRNDRTPQPTKSGISLC